MRPHVAAVYAFARLADDMADEGRVSAAARHGHLDAWRRRLHQAAAGDDAAAEGDHGFVFVALEHAMRTLDLPVTLFDDLLSAFGQDITTDRYASWSDVFDYCRRSANPVGRLVLKIAGDRGEALARSSDALCTSLQLTNFWQDFGRDWRAGRLYVPGEVVQACGALESDLEHGHMSAEWIHALEVCVSKTRTLYEDGRSVCDGVPGRLRFELRLTWLGGRRILEEVERQRHHLLVQRPSLGGRDWPRLLWRAVMWGGRRD
jgi:squalene synthase HpnC